MPRAVIAWAPAVAVMAAIFFGSSLQNIGDMPAGQSAQSWHFIEYVALGGALTWAFASARWSAMGVGAGLRALAGSAVFGALDEWHQAFVPGRTPDFQDWLADTGGAAVIIILLVLMTRARRAGGPPAGREV